MPLLILHLLNREKSSPVKFQYEKSSFTKLENEKLHSWEAFFASSRALTMRAIAYLNQ